MTWHPELMPAVLEGGRRDVELLNSGRTCLALRLPYVDLDEAEQLAALFEGELGTDQPICGVMVLPPAAAGEPPARVPSLQWDLVLRGSSERTARFPCNQLLERQRRQEMRQLQTPLACCFRPLLAF
jgi:hypothetical protein